jgi:hypothetical protein
MMSFFSGLIFRTTFRFFRVETLKERQQEFSFSPGRSRRSQERLFAIRDCRFPAGRYISSQMES